MSKKVEQNIMQSCKITLTSSVDGKETQIIRKGKASFSLMQAVVTYCEENAKVTLTFEKNGAKIERRGDYGLSLLLEEGKTLDGTLNLSGSVGDIRVYTHKIAYSLGKDSLLASVQYDLIFGEERQEMKLRLYVKAE